MFPLVKLQKYFSFLASHILTQYITLVNDAAGFEGDVKVNVIKVLPTLCFWFCPLPSYYDNFTTLLPISHSKHTFTHRRICRPFVFFFLIIVIKEIHFTTFFFQMALIKQLTLQDRKIKKLQNNRRSRSINSFYHNPCERTECPVLPMDKARTILCIV